MPIRIPNALPSAAILSNENIFVMTEDRATTQDIRPLKIAIFNVMPTKITTETQLLRLLSNTPLQVDITLVHPQSYLSTHTPLEHLKTFYKTFEQIQSEKFDGMIFTGAPVEKLDYHQVAYWDELMMLMDWSLENVFSSIHICWGAQAALYHHYGVPKYELPEKLFGVFSHHILTEHNPLLRGFDDVFYMPHSRHTEVRKEDIETVRGLEVVCESEEAGVGLAMTPDGRQIFITGHGEYDRDTLLYEYQRDVQRGAAIKIPKHYFQNDDPSLPPIVQWRAHANLFYFNWLNFVYQETPYNIDAITKIQIEK